MARVEQLTARMMAILKQRAEPNPALSAPNQEMSIAAGAQYWQTAMQNPAQVFE
jgi:polyhydroxyalkanoate synthase